MKEKIKDIIKKSVYQICMMAGFALLAVSWSGCVEEVDLSDQMGEARRLVLYCRLCPQVDSTWIWVSHSQPLYGAGSHVLAQSVEDAIVELSADSVHWVRAAYHPERTRYLITLQELPVAEGHTYYIRVSHADFETITASCTVPIHRNVEARFDTVYVERDVHDGEIYDMPHRDVYLTWRDYPAEDNYYALIERTLMSYYYYDPHTDEEWLTQDWSCNLGYMQDNGIWTRFISDAGRDGQVIRCMYDEVLDIYDDDEDEDDEEEEIPTYYMTFMDRNTYLFEATVTYADEDIGSFLLEPTRTYSNIQNGFGLFGAITMMEIGK